MGQQDDISRLMKQIMPEEADLIDARDWVIDKWCREHAKDKDDLTWEDIEAIRQLREWQYPRLDEV